MDNWKNSNKIKKNKIFDQNKIKKKKIVTKNNQGKKTNIKKILLYFKNFQK